MAAAVSVEPPSSAWETSWRTLEAALERDRRQRRELIAVRTQALEVERGLRKTSYERLERDAKADEASRIRAVQDLLGASLQRLSQVVQEPASPFKPQKLGPIMRSIVDTEVPKLVSDAASMPSVAVLRDLLKNFDRLYEQWKRDFVPTQITTRWTVPPPLSAELKSSELKTAPALAAAVVDTKVGPGPLHGGGAAINVQLGPAAGPADTEHCQGVPAAVDIARARLLRAAGTTDGAEREGGAWVAEQVRRGVRWVRHRLGYKTASRGRSPRRVAAEEKEEREEDERARLARRNVTERELEVRMTEVASKFETELQELIRALNKEAGVKAQARLKQRVSALEQGTPIATIQTEIKALEDAQQVRDILFSNLRAKARTTLEQLTREATKARSAVAQQRRLIEQARQTIVPVPAPNTRVKRAYPTPGSVRFGEELARLYPSLRMGPAPDISEGSHCQQPGPGEPPAPAKPYQRLMRDILTVDSPYRGFLAYDGPGTGKTRLAWGTIEQWFLDRIEDTGSTGAAILVLLPTDRLVGTWRADTKWLERFRVTVAPGGNAGTLILHLVHLPRPGDRTTAGPGVVVLHKMTMVLPDTALTAMRRTTDAMVSNDQYVLKAYDYKTNEAYKNLTSDERRLLNDAQRTQENEVLRRSKLAIPSKTLVVVDEAHNLVNPAEIAKISTSANTTLAFVNLLTLAVQCKLLLLTATPLLDASRLSDLFKLLNLEQPDESKRWFEGTWRQALTADASPDLREAFLRADEAETRYLESRAFDSKGDWRPGEKLRLQESYAGIVSYVTLAHDPTLYPSISRDCDANPTCTFRWDGDTVRDVDATALQQLGLPRPHQGRNLLVPLTARQWKEMQKAMGDDLAHWNQRRRLDAAADRPEYAGLNYGIRQTKASVMVSWGLKSYTERGHVEWSPKLRAALFFLRKYANDKHYLFTASQDQRIATQVNDFFDGEGDYDVVDIPAVADLVQQHAHVRDRVDPVTGVVKETAAKIIAGEWYAAAKPQRRLLLFVGSATTLAAVPEKIVALVREVMVELFNDDRNLSGNFYQAFIGDRGTKEGLSLFHVRHAHLLDVPTGPTMLEQAEARVLRFCSHQKFPVDKWSVTLWRYMSIPPAATAKPPRKPRARAAGAQSTPQAANRARGLRGRAGGAKAGMPDAETRVLNGIDDAFREDARRGGATPPPMTNEEYQYDYIEKKEPPSEKVLEALRAIAIDCQLFHEYNTNQTCFGSSPTAIAAPVANRRDSFCMALNHVLLRDQDAAGLAEFDEIKANANVLPAEQFDSMCGRVLAPPVHLPPASYRDLLVEEALNAAKAAAAVAMPDLALPPDTVVAHEVLKQLARTDATFSMEDDLRLWQLSTAVRPEHRDALLTLIGHRLNRRSKEDRAAFAVAVDQLRKLMQQQREAIVAAAALDRFFELPMPTLSGIEQQARAAEELQRQNLARQRQTASASVFRFAGAAAPPPTQNIPCRPATHSLPQRLVLAF